MRTLVLGRAGRAGPGTGPSAARHRTGEPLPAPIAHPHSSGTGGCEGRKRRGASGRYLLQLPYAEGLARADGAGRQTAATARPRPWVGGSASATVGVLRRASAERLFGRLPVGPLTVQLLAGRGRDGGSVSVRLQPSVSHWFLQFLPSFPEAVLLLPSLSHQAMSGAAKSGGWDRGKRPVWRRRRRSAGRAPMVPSEWRGEVMREGMVPGAPPRGGEAVIARGSVSCGKGPVRAVATGGRAPSSSPQSVCVYVCMYVSVGGGCAGSLPRSRRSGA